MHSLVYSKMQVQREEPNLYILNDDEKEKAEIILEDLFERNFSNYNIRLEEGKGILIEKNQSPEGYLKGLFKSEKFIWYFKTQFQKRIFGLLQKRENSNTDYEYGKSEQKPLEAKEEQFLDLLSQKQQWLLYMSESQLWLLPLKGRFTSYIEDRLAYVISLNLGEKEEIEKQKPAYLTSSLILISNSTEEREENETLLKKLKSYDSKLDSKKLEDNRIEARYQIQFLDREDISFIKQQYRNISEALTE